jgi:Methyltransferase FkbM domain
VVTLDGYARENGIGAVAFLKLDTEGMELEVLEGGRQTLQRTREIAMETHGEEKHHAALSRLHESGFTLESEKFNGRTGLVRAVHR